MKPASTTPTESEQGRATSTKPADRNAEPLSRRRAFRYCSSGPSRGRDSRVRASKEGSTACPPEQVPEGAPPPTVTTLPRYQTPEFRASGESGAKTVFCASPIRTPQQPVASLPFCLQVIDLYGGQSEQGRAPEAAAAWHLYRPGVASVTDRRCICHAKALHLSAEVPFFALKTITSRPLL